MELFPDITSDIISFNGRNQFFVGSPADKEGCEFDPENLSKREKLFRACSSLDLGYIEVWDTEHSSWEIVRKSIECKYWESDERNIHTDPENEQS
jgi:hypothetical protein